MIDFDDDDGKTELIKLVERALQDKRERDRRKQQGEDQSDIAVAFEADRLPNTRGFEPT